MTAEDAAVTHVAQVARDNNLDPEVVAELQTIRSFSEPLDLEGQRRSMAGRAASVPLPGTYNASIDAPSSAGLTRASSTTSRASISSLLRPSKAPGMEQWKAAGTTVADAICTKHGYQHLRDLCRGDIKYVTAGQLRHLKTLGEGAFAEVSIAELSESDPNVSPFDTNNPPPTTMRTVAVKALKPDMVESEGAVMDFIEEVRVLSRLRHKSIVELVGVGSYDTSSSEAEWRTLFLVQEYMNSGTLKATILRQMVRLGERVYSYSDALRWALTVAEGIAFLHAHKPLVIHRDLKCDNIMLSKIDGRMEAKIGDLGLHALVQHRSGNVDSLGSPLSARALDEFDTPLKTSKSYARVEATIPDDDAGDLVDMEAALYKMTGQTGAFCYMAPEVFMNKPYNEAVDVFSFGVILYELFAKRLLAAAYMNSIEWDESKLHANKVAAGFRPPFPANMPESVREIIDACWSGTPELRPRMKEVVRKLRAVDASGVALEMDSKGPAAGAGGCCSVM